MENKEIVNKMSLSEENLSDKDIENLVENLDTLASFCDRTNSFILILQQMVKKGKIVATKEVENSIDNMILDFYILKETIKLKSNTYTIH